MTPSEIQNKSFERKGMGGYRADEVDAYLGQIAAYVQRLEEEKQELQDKMMVLAEKLEEYREDEDSLRAALIGAQKLGDSVVRDAKKKAEAILTEANAKAEEIVGDARSSIDREAFTLTKMQSQVAEFKTQILNIYQRHIEMLKSIPDEFKVPADVRGIIEKAAEKAPVQAAPKKDKKEAVGKVESFVITYDDMEIPLDVVDDTEPAPEPEPQSVKHKRDFGELRFGEEYNLTRND